MADYKPSLDFGLPNPAASDQPGDSPGVAWEAAPASSHVHSWRYYDTRGDEGRLLRKFPGEIGRGRSELHVRFKDADGNPTPASGYYVYYFESAGAGANVLEKLRTDPHPYSGVVKPYLIDARIPYSRA